MLPVCYSCSLCNTHLFSLLLRRQLRSTLFPYTTLFRSQLVQADLIAYQKPLYQVLALPEDSKVPAPTLPRSGQTQSVADILRRVVEGGQAVSAPWPLTAADGRYPADKLGR